jgi:hypothetical protein
LGYSIELIDTVYKVIYRRETPHHHDKQRCDKALVGIELLRPARAFDRRRGRRYLLHAPEEADKDTAMG